MTTESGARLRYDHLVVWPGIQLDWGKVPGMADALDAGRLLELRL